MTHHQHVWRGLTVEYTRSTLGSLRVTAVQRHDGRDFNLSIDDAHALRQDLVQFWKDME